MYHVRISKTEIVDKMQGRRWEKGGPEQVGNDGYGYTPMISKPTEVIIEVLSQSLEELDLPAVIKALNKL